MDSENADARTGLVSGNHAGGKTKKHTMQTDSPNLLEIANSFNHWSEHLDVDGHIDEHEFLETSSVAKLIRIQECGFFETYRGDIFSADGFLQAVGVRVCIEPRGWNNGECATITINGTAHRTQDFREITSDTLTGPGGWYVVVYQTEAEE